MHHSALPEYFPITESDPQMYTLGEFPPLLKDFANEPPGVIYFLPVYTENSETLENTLKAICDNVRFLEQQGVPSNKIAVVMFQDGYSEIKDSVVGLAEKLNLFHPEQVFGTHGNTYHCFASELKYSDCPKFTFISCLKRKNKGLHDSLFWFLNLFCVNLEPKYCALLHCGVQPAPDATFLLLQKLQSSPKVAGACGQVKVKNPNYYNYIEASQDAEYILNNILEKPFRSLLGLASSKSFVAYKWNSLKETLDSRVLQREQSCALSNAVYSYQALITAELVPKNCEFVNQAKSYTVIPKHTGPLVAQRKKWVNGDLFSLKYYLSTKLPIYTMVSSLSTGLQCLAPGIIYLLVHIALERSFGARTLLEVFYGFLWFLVVVVSLGNQPQDNALVLLVLGILQTGVIMFAVGLYTNQMYIWESSAWVVVFIFAYLAVVLLLSLLYGELVSLGVGIIQYMMMLPFYFNLYLVYGFCNLNVLPQKRFRNFRTRFLVGWVSVNFGLVVFFTV